MNLQEQFLYFTTKNAELYFNQYLTEFEKELELKHFQKAIRKSFDEQIYNESTNWTLQKAQELFKNELIEYYSATVEFQNEETEEIIKLNIDNNNLLNFEFEDNAIILNSQKFALYGFENEDIIPTMSKIDDLFYELNMNFTIYVHPYRTDLKDNKKLLENIKDELEEDNEIVDFIAELKDRTKEITMLDHTEKDNYKEFYVLDLNNIK
ncbi:hypothetical protein ACM0JF_01080 [Mycoplasma sp. 654]|uniref:hypothetical protein n=1 Tax=Mycoplasma sp. 654 TaxID=3398773 RepID=UPI003A8BD504